MCAKLLQSMGAETVTQTQDIDIAHRVPPRNPSANQNPQLIVCRFNRRLERELVMKFRKDACKVDGGNMPVECYNLGSPFQRMLFMSTINLRTAYKKTEDLFTRMLPLFVLS